MSLPLIKSFVIICLASLLLSCGTITSTATWRHDIEGVPQSQTVSIRIWCDYSEGRFTITAVDGIRDQSFLTAWCGTGWLKPGQHTLSVWGRQIHKWMIAGNGMGDIIFHANPGSRYLLKGELKNCMMGKCKMVMRIINELDHTIVAGPIVAEAR